MKRPSAFYLMLVLVAGCGSDKGGTTPTGDVTPPSSVLDLAARVENESTAVLTWTAPGDDGETGTATRYDLRWSQTGLTEETWNTGSPCPNLPAPSAAGSSETYRTSNLPPDSSLVFMLRSVDEADNWSRVSNPASVTLPSRAAVCSLSVLSLDFGTVAPHDSSTQDFTITNVGGGRLAGTVETGVGPFTVVSGQGFFDLGSSESHSVSVQFMPAVSGPATASISFGSDTCDALLCSGTGTGPFCVTDVDTLRFGNVYVDDSATRRVELTNHGDTWVAVAPRLEGCLGFRFPFDQPFVLEPGESRFLTLHFEPWQDGPIVCTLELNAGGTCDRVTLVAEGVGPACWLSAEGRVLAPIAVGDAVETSFTIENRGGGLVEGTIAASCADFTIVAGAGPFAFRHGEGRVVRVRFAPESAGEQTCVIETGSELCHPVTITGTGHAAICRVEPDTVDFGTVEVGSITETTFTITNDGVGTLNGTIPLQCGDFGMSEAWGNFALGPGESKTCHVRFQPLAAGPSACALSLGTSCESVILRGEAMGELCRVEPAIVDFGSVPFGTNVERIVTITNTGGGQLSGDVWIDCPGFSLGEGGGSFTLEAGDSRDVSVRCSPVDEGPQVCLLNIGGTSCASVECRVDGIGAICEFSAASVDFGSVPLQAVRDSTITVTNVGHAPILGITTLEGDPEFSLTAGGGPIWLDPGRSRDFTVQFQPFSLGTSACTLFVGSCAAVPIVGASFDPEPVCAVSKDTLSLGLDTVGDIELQASFRIRNTGGQTLSGAVTLASSDFELVAGAGPFSLGANEAHTVSVRFGPTAVGLRTSIVELGIADCPPVVCEGVGVSYRVFAEMDHIDDVARLFVNGLQAYTAWYGRLGTDRTGWEPIGHYPGASGVLDVTAHLVPGDNQLQFTLENTVCCDASIRVRVWKDEAPVFADEFADHTNPPRGIVYDESFVFDAVVE